MQESKHDLIQIAGRALGPGVEPWIIAELSANHNGSLERALAIIDAAASAGAHAVKLQTYTPQTMTLNVKSKGFVIEEESLWKGRSLYDLYQQAQTPWEWHQLLLQRCRHHGLVGFSSPFDESAVELLEQLEVPCYKVASLEILDHLLLQAIAATGKPIFLSIGAAWLHEVEEAVEVIERVGGGPVILLKCTSAYPTPYDQAHLRTLEHMKQRFGPLIGLSDHTQGIATSLGAVALGACAIEKHLTLDRADGGLDAPFSLEPPELAQLCCEANRVWQALGRVQYGPTSGETVSYNLRRSLYVSKPVEAGERVSQHNVRAIRPGAGLSPKYWDRVKERSFRCDCPVGTPLSWTLLSELEPTAPYLETDVKQTVAIVQARMGSTRLPGKVLLPLAGKPCLEWIVQRLRCCARIDQVVVATGSDSRDDPIAQWCATFQVCCVRGSQEDVLSRFLLAAGSADLLVRITADCPLVDPELVDAFIEQFMEQRSSCHGVSNAPVRTFARGLDVEVVPRQVLEDLSQQPITRSEREHVTLGLYQRPERYRIAVPSAERDSSHYRWTLDSPLDYAYLHRIYEALKVPFIEGLEEGRGQQVGWTRRVLELLEAHPEWAHLNGSEQQKQVAQP